eukprot:CAMPEP_0119000614 /NCGR_PEP_ID=MMETSP1173-20130426/64167_1 /TAXON_ID=1034831 /ORGANISM="Rhizochromulina marina cf, Strain CCMP1243" /LENGTH=39 /DNA_ID= /DNA_START= /DNA_END= /DNA_ORIENTATION=
MATEAPSPTKVRVVWEPSPPLAPVTTATLPSKGQAALPV